MKILHTIDTGGIYGKERMLLALVKKQIEEGHTVYVMGFGKQDFFDEMLMIADYTVRLEHIRSLWGVLQDGLYDIVHSHDYKTGIITAYWHIWNPGRKLVRTVHGYSGHLKKGTKIDYYEKLDRFMLRYNSGVVAVSDQLGDELGSDVIYNGIEVVDQFEQPPRLREDILEFCRKGIEGYDKPFVFCCMARLSKEKNLSNLIEAIHSIPRAKLLLFGDGPLREELEKQSMWGDKVFFAGFDKNARYYLNWVDAYIQPSLSEGMPISVLEALSLGVPMMTSNVGGMTILHKGEAVSNCSKTPGVMAMTMQEFMKHPEDRLGRAKTKGKELFEKYFSADAMYHNYQTFYQQLT